MGKKDFPAANCLRAFLGESEALSDQILEICCNLDDMTPEGVGFAMEQLLQGGALDVYTTPITMKKCRPAVLLTCLCRLEDHDRMVGLCFRYTTTIGVRTHLWNRCVLERSEETRKTQFGAVRVKRSAGWGVVREKAEYDDLAEIARKEERSLADITSSIRTNQEDPNKGFM
jgi:hypothetical protein